MALLQSGTVCIPSACLKSCEELGWAGGFMHQFCLSQQQEAWLPVTCSPPVGIAVLCPTGAASRPSQNAAAGAAFFISPIMPLLSWKWHWLPIQSTGGFSPTKPCGVHKALVGIGPSYIPIVSAWPWCAMALQGFPALSREAGQVSTSGASSGRMSPTPSPPQPLQGPWSPPLTACCLLVAFRQQGPQKTNVSHRGTPPSRHSP